MLCVILGFVTESLPLNSPRTTGASLAHVAVYHATSSSSVLQDVSADVVNTQMSHASTCRERFTTPLAASQRANDSQSFSVNEGQLTVLLSYTDVGLVQRIQCRHN